MKTNLRYIRTDLASESSVSCGPGEARKERENETHGISYQEEKEGKFVCFRLKIESEEGAAVLGKPVGQYVTLDVGRLWMADDADFRAAVRLLSGELRRLADQLAPGAETILIIGLGNRDITSDAIGPLAVHDVTATRHVRECQPELFSRLFTIGTATLSPGVVGQTGIETLELIRGAVNRVQPSLVLLIDALAARSVERLGTTIQLSDTGLAPGSGIGNHRQPIGREQLGVPVIAIGVPTIVDSATLVCDVLEKAGMTEIPQPLEDELNRGRDFFVTLKDSDLAVAEMARLLSESINKTFQTKL